MIKRFIGVPAGSTLSLSVSSSSERRFRPRALITGAGATAQLDPDDFLAVPELTLRDPSRYTVEVQIKRLQVGIEEDEDEADPDVTLMATIRRPDGTVHSKPLVYRFGLAGSGSESGELTAGFRIDVAGEGVAAGGRRTERRRWRPRGEQDARGEPHAGLSVGAGPPAESSGAAAGGAGGGLEPPAGKRYANSTLLAPGPDGPAPPDPLPPNRSIEPRARLRLRVEIGPTPIWPEQPELPELPDDVWLDVVVSSTQFRVGRTEERPVDRAAWDRLFLPGDGGVAVAENSDPYLDFSLEAPSTAQISIARIQFFYRGALVQSQRLQVAIGGKLDDSSAGLGATWRVATDFTQSRRLAGLDSIPERPRVCIVTGGPSRQLTARAANLEGALVGEPMALELDEAAIGRKMRELRDELRGRSPQKWERSRTEFRRDLEKLAPHGWELYAHTAHRFAETLVVLDEDPERAVLQICRPETSTFSIPWHLLYDIHLETDAVENGELRLCPLVAEWDGRSNLVDDLSARRCPRADELDHGRNVLCPFGFFGFRYSLEQLTSTAEKVLKIEAPDRFLVTCGETHRGVNRKVLGEHLDELEQILVQRFRHARIERAPNLEKLRSLLSEDQPLVYFYAHGIREAKDDPDTLLMVGSDERFSPQDFLGWRESWRRDERKLVWDRIRPLIFINACHSLEINPATLSTYLDAFVGDASAAGVIGTEVRVGWRFAMEFAAEFLRHFAGDGLSVDESLRRVRMSLLQVGNIGGLNYTPHCWADLALRAA